MQTLCFFAMLLGFLNADTVVFWVIPVILTMVPVFLDDWSMFLALLHAGIGSCNDSFLRWMQLPLSLWWFPLCLKCFWHCSLQKPMFLQRCWHYEVHRLFLLQWFWLSWVQIPLFSQWFWDLEVQIVYFFNAIFAQECKYRCSRNNICPQWATARPTLLNTLE